MKCEHCECTYTEEEVEEMLIAMFDTFQLVDEDYLVQIYGLCPDCWPET